MGRASVVNDGDTAFASQYEALRDGYAVREQVPATYVVWTQDGTTYGDHCLGSGLDFSGTTVATVINDVLSSGLTSGRTWQQKVFLKGNFTIGTPIEVADYTILEANGLIKLDDNADCHTLVNTDQTSNGNAAIKLIGLKLDGNEANQGAGLFHGIYFNNPGTPAPQSGGEAGQWAGLYSYKIIDCHVTRAQGSALKLDGISGAIVQGGTYRWGSTSTEAYGLYLRNVSDSSFIGPGWCCGNTYAGYLYYGTANHFVNWYFAGSDEHGVYCDSIQRYIFTNCRVDGHDKQGWYLGGAFGCFKNSWTGCTVSNTGTYLAADNTYSGWFLSGNGVGNESRLNTFTGNTVCGWGTLTNKFKYGFEEDTNDADYNVYIGNVIEPAAVGTAGILLDGANSFARSNIGYTTENSGTATITNPATSEVVAHGLDVTPTVDDFTITLAENPTNAITALWVDTIGAANFTVNVEPAPGASNLDFGWHVVVL